MDSLGFFRGSTFFWAELPLSPCFHPHSRGAISFARCMLGVRFQPVLPPDQRPIVSRNRGTWARRDYRNSAWVLVFSLPGTVKRKSATFTSCSDVESMTIVTGAQRSSSSIATRPLFNQKWGPRIVTTGRALTAREREVLTLLVEGRTMMEVAKILHVRKRTIAFHKYHIMKDFDLHSNWDVLKFAMRKKLILPR